MNEIKKRMNNRMQITQNMLHIHKFTYISHMIVYVSPRLHATVNFVESCCKLLGANSNIRHYATYADIYISIYIIFILFYCIYVMCASAIYENKNTACQR